MITANINKMQRIVRFVLGTLLLSWAFSGGPLWTYVGFYFSGTAAWSLCPVVSFWMHLRRPQSLVNF